jgi:ComEC/Rec2-related protein
VSQHSCALFFLFRQRAPFAGIFVAACLGIIVSDQRPEWWPYWVGGFLLATPATFIIRSTWPALILVFAIFAFWHGNQVATDQGYQRSRDEPFDAGEHAVTLVLLSEPKIGGIESFQRFLALVRSVDNRPAHFLASAECSGEPLSYGDCIRAQGKFQVPDKPMNPGQFDFGNYLRRQSTYLNFRAQNRKPVSIIAQNQGDPLSACALDVRHKILGALQEGLEEEVEVAQTIQGMFLGARGESSDELKRLFQDTGTIHLFAASGLQLGFFTGVAWSILRYFRFPRQCLSLTVIPVAIAYCALTEFHPATIRAVVMAIFLAVGASLERPVATINSLCGSGVLILVHDTQQLYQVGFQLSFVSVLTILTGAKPFADLLYRPFQVDAFMPRHLLTTWQRFWRNGMFRVCELFSLSAVCWIATAPILILQDHRLSLVSVFANLLVVPLATTVMLLGVASLATGTISNGIAACFNNSGWLLTKGILAILHTLTLIPGHCLNVSPASLIAPDQVTALATGYEHIFHIHAGGHDWLINTGRLSEWRAITGPYLRFEGVNRIERLILPDPPSHAGKLLGEIREDFSLCSVTPSVEWEFDTEHAAADSSEQSRLESVDDRLIELSSSDQERQLKSGAHWPSVGSILVHLGRFRVLILPTVTEGILAMLKPEHADVVYCGRLHDRNFPRDLIVEKLSPEVLVMSGTKPELTANPCGNGASPECYFLKQGGAVTTLFSAGELRVRNYCGSEFRLPSPPSLIRRGG